MYLHWREKKYTLFAPDIKLDNNGIIHAAYIDPNATNNGKVYYQTFDTNTDLWGTRVQVGDRGPDECRRWMATRKSRRSGS